MSETRGRWIGATRRHVLSAGAAAALGGVFSTACGGSGSANTPLPASGPVELVHFNLTSEASIPPFKEAIALFEQKNPDIKVRFLSAPTPAAEKFRTMVAAGEVLDVSYVGVLELRELGPKGIFEPLNSYVARDKLNVANYRASSLNATTVDGKYYALPLGINPSVMFYNTDAFKKIGLAPPPRSWSDKTWTWDRFVDAAQRLTKRSESTSTSQYGWFDVGTFGDLVALIAAGGQWFDNRIKATKCVCDTAEGGRGLQFVQDLTHKYRIRGTSQDEKDLGGVDTAFASGQVAMINGDWKRASTLLAPIKDFQWAAAPYPVGPSGKPVTNVLHNSAGMSAVTKYKDQAWKFQRWLTWDKEGIELHTKGANMAAVKHVDPKNVYPLKDHLADAQVLIDAAEVGYPLYDTVGVTTEMNRAKSAEMNKLYANTQNGRDTAAATQRAVNALFQ
jgi:multiple sugar transport system substrate-binding protein